LRVVHIASRDIVGGAAIAAYRLHSGLSKIGVSSDMLVGWKASADLNVHALRRNWSRLANLRRRIVNWQIRKDFDRYRDTVLPTLELLTDDRNASGGDVVANMPDADVYNLHWVSGLIAYRKFFATLPRAQPLVWTLHDMNPFTGGCHYTAGCERFRSTCGTCPQLGSKEAADLTARIHARKTIALARLGPETTRIVAPSRWMKAQANSSSLMRNFDVLWVPYGLDTDAFAPRDRGVAREVFGIPHEGKVVLFAAEAVGNYRKGFDLLIAAIDRLEIGEPVVLVSIGEDNTTQIPQSHISLGTLASARLLSFAYSMADVFVAPARQENFGQVVLEAMSCGTPVVGFDVGGLPDMIRPGQTGLLAPPEDIVALSNAIATLLKDNALRSRLSAECRRITIEEYALTIQARRYRTIYEDLIETCRRLGARTCDSGGIH
jgi:glycosyltransferase involved in cell wall biosynthesis